MRNILSLTLLSLLFACGTAPQHEPVDFVAEEVAIKEVFETLFKSIEDRNVDLLVSFFADDGIFWGTDPDDLFPKDSLVASWTQIMQMPEIEIFPFEFINESFIRIHPNGKTAVVVQQRSEARR